MSRRPPATNWAQVRADALSGYRLNSPSAAPIIRPEPLSWTLAAIIASVALLVGTALALSA